jgi:hypothetical protein
MVNRIDLTNKLKQEIDEFGAQIDGWESKAKVLSEQLKGKYDRNMLDLKNRLELANAKLDEIEQIGSNVSDTLRDDAETVWQDLKGAMHKIRSIFD